ncbi:hypothetical protein PIB30_008520 [Stylosanthes scabra]|uniref:Uncharacterized protein n=1 Tax=Stylosanthes scabra TaxID=79078 RepID=A0ABU6Z1P9_9FABA|nr:hypothetical protein [Stylosanthes scabra]
MAVVEPNQLDELGLALDKINKPFLLVVRPSSKDKNIGMELEKDRENGLILKEEIKKKVEELLGNEDIRARSMKMKELIMNNIAHGGQSSKNIQMFINWAN